MGSCLFANNAVATLAGAVAIADTTISLASGQGAKFPSPTGSDFFYVTLYNASELEIIKVTARAGDALTVVRGQQGTAAAAFGAGDKAEMRVTGDALTGFAQTSQLGTAAFKSVGEIPGDVADGEFTVRTGMVSMFAGPSGSVPSDYLLCDGSAVSRTTYARLFGVVGTAYGAGDGSTTFNLPNLVNNFPVGAGGAHALAATGGSDTMNVTVQGHALTVSELPAHNHPLTDPGHNHGVLDGQHSHGVSDPGHAHNYTAMQAPWNGSNSDVAAGTSGTQYSSSTTPSNTGVSVIASSANISLQAAATGASVGNTGSGTAHTHTNTTSTNLPPFLGLNFIIKT